MISYLITDPTFYTQDLATFEVRLHQVFTSQSIGYALYRDKENSDYSRFAERFVRVAQSYGIKSMLHNQAKLAQELGAYGVHYSSDRLCSMGIGDQGLFRVLSCHSEAEIAFAQAQGVDAASYSPIFETPNKGKPVGLASLKHISGKITLPIIALGGIITQEQIKSVEEAGAWGFASIRYFFKDL